MSPPLFAPLPTVAGGFGCVHADPPIRFRSNSRERPGRNAARHYRTFDYAVFEALPVADIVAEDAFLFLWIPSAFLVIGEHLAMVKAWGFKPTAMGFVWAKLNPSGNGLFMGPGLTTRKNCEFCILARRGKPQRLAADVLETIISARRDHSRKPEEVYARIERYCAGPRLDLFARQQRDGWTVYGDQISRFDFEGPLGRAPLIRAQDRPSHLEFGHCMSACGPSRRFREVAPTSAAGLERTSRATRQLAELDPGCVKTRRL
jgi:N6-adenosine-specific RNA methylase IME4